MKIRWIFFALILILILNGCNALGNNLREKSSILKNQSNELIELSKIADIIDNDEESYWAYGIADSILSMIDFSGKTYLKDLNKIYSAYTYIFYGMSYTRSILAYSRGEKYSLEELNRIIVQPSNNDVIDYLRIAKNELSSIYSMIYFYKVSRMPRFNNMYRLFQKDSLENENIFKKYSTENAFRIVSLRNKKLYFKVLVGMILDIYSVNNKNTNEFINEKYFQGLVTLGEEMDKIPSKSEVVTKLSNQEYYNFILKSSEIQNSMLKLLVNEIRTLRQRNQ